MPQTAFAADMMADADVAKAFGVNFRGRRNSNIWCPFHENPRTSNSRSCSVGSNGLFNCKACGASGDVFSFVAKRDNLDRDTVIKQLGGTKNQTAPSQSAPVRRTLTMRDVERRVKNLQGGNRPDFMEYLIKERGLSPASIKTFHIGCDEHRICIPVFDTKGVPVNIRRYKPHAEGMPKMVQYAEGYGAAHIYPHDVLMHTPHNTELVLCEGEWDAVLLNQHGFPAVTITSGVVTWNDEFTKALAGRNIVIIYDVNDKPNPSYPNGDMGQHVAMERAALLQEVGCTVKVVRLTLPSTCVGGDVTNWFSHEGRTSDALRALIDQTPIFGPDPERSSLSEDCTAPEIATESVTLAAASKSEYYYKHIHMVCLVAGKGIAPFLPPKKVTIQYKDEEGGEHSITKIFDPWDGVILSLINCSDARLRQILRPMCGVPKDCQSKLEIDSTFNIEEVYLIPAIDFRANQGPYVIQKAYYIGHGLITNRVYNFEGYTLPDPRSQAATHILVTATPAETDIDTYVMSTAASAQLAKLFHDRKPQEIFDTINLQLAEHVTKIYGRPDLHTALDLVFHSVMGFEFDGVMVKRGWLDVLIVGDTRTGKGFVAEGLINYYRVGEVVSGENVTTAGLVGAVQKLGDRWTLVWGKLPLADKRLIVIDEASSLSSTDISHLSRIRSEGIAEITKVISEKTTCRTRLIWLANPRPSNEGVHHSMADYNHGIEAVEELVGAPEDIARFDYAIIVAHNEVSAATINQRHKASTILQYSAELCRELVMWAWSRAPEHIKISAAVTEYIMKVSRELAKQYSSKIPLVQGEDVRFKLARVAIAVACRLYSTPNGQDVVVKQEHVEFAYNFFHRIYNSQACGYAQFSSVDRERSTLRDAEGVENVIMSVGDAASDLIDGLIIHRQISYRDLCDYSGVDIYQARAIVSELVRLRAMIKEYSWYVKRPAFKEFLRKLKTKLHPEVNVTGDEDD